MAGLLNVDSITNSAGTGAPTFPFGANISSGGLSITGNLTVSGSTTLTGGGSVLDTMNFAGDVTIISPHVLKVNTISNAAGTGAPSFPNGASITNASLTGGAVVTGGLTVSGSATLSGGVALAGGTTMTGGAVSVSGGDLTITAIHLLAANTIQSTTTGQGVAILGNTSGTLAASGYVGEIFDSGASGNVTVNTTGTAVVSLINLPAGDWDITAWAGNTNGTAGANHYMLMCINPTSAVVSGIPGFTLTSGTIDPVNQYGGASMPVYPYTASSITTLFLNARYDTTSGTMQGRMIARRVR